MNTTTGVTPLRGTPPNDVLGQIPYAVAVATCLTGEGTPASAVLAGVVPLGASADRIMIVGSASSTFASYLHQGDTCWVSLLAKDQSDVVVSLAGASAGAESPAARPIAWREEDGLAAVPQGAIGWIAGTAEEILVRAGSFVAFIDPQTVQLERDTHPMVGFQGGFGGFMPTSLTAAAHPGLEDALRIARIAQDPIELVAREIGAECSVIGYADGDEVALAVANYSPTARGTQIGETFPVVPPIGILFVDGSPTGLDEEQWLSRVELAGSGDHTAWRELARTQLMRVRQRGWSIMVGGPRTPHDLDQLLESSKEKTDVNVRRLDLVRTVRAMAKSHEPEHINDDEFYDVHALTVPVQSSSGATRVTLRLVGLPPQASGAEIRFWLSLLEQARTGIEMQL